MNRLPPECVPPEEGRKLSVTKCHRLDVAMIAHVRPWHESLSCGSREFWCLSRKSRLPPLTVRNLLPWLESALAVVGQNKFFGHGSPRKCGG